MVLFAAAACAAPAQAQPSGSDSTAPGSAPAAKKSAKHKPPAAPATTAEAASAVAGGAKPTLLKQFGDWGAYTATPSGRKVCFALAKPASSQDNPANRRNASNTVYMFISSRPAEKVKDEVSILISGYAFKPSTDASLAVGNSSFPMYTQSDGAWIKNAADEAKMVEAMRKGADVVVKGMTSKGTQTTDTFSLKGITQALDRVAQECK